MKNGFLGLVIIFTFVAGLQNLSYSSDEMSNDAIYAELMGYSLILGIGYERLIFDSLGLSVGFGGHVYQSAPAVNELSFLSVPVLASYYIGSNRKRLYLEAGALLFRSYNNNHTFSDLFQKGDSIKPIFGIGYNLRNSPSGFYLKAGVAMTYVGGSRQIFGFWPIRPVFAFPRISLGYAF
ncbi:MAG: hypothetical protein OEZ36_10750 [Spirochaetota bacterium]|nr:hypothetical protein [Spirochaetota bacterium]